MTWIRTVVAQLRDIRTEQLAIPEPSADAPASEHGWYILGQVLGRMLTLRFWVFTFAVATVVQVALWLT